MGLYIQTSLLVSYWLALPSPDLWAQSLSQPEQGGRSSNQISISLGWVALRESWWLLNRGDHFFRLSLK